MFWLSGHALGHYSIWNILVSGGKPRETVRNGEQGVGWWKCLNLSSNFIWRFIKGNGEKENWPRQCSFSKTSLCEGENLKSPWCTAGICREICVLKILSYIFITTHFPISFLIEARHPFDEWTQFSAVEQVLKVGAALSLWASMIFLLHDTGRLLSNSVFLWERDGSLASSSISTANLTGALNVETTWAASLIEGAHNVLC